MKKYFFDLHDVKVFWRKKGHRLSSSNDQGTLILSSEVTGIVRDEENNR